MTFRLSQSCSLIIAILCIGLLSCDNETPTLVVLGDSFTAGYGAVIPREDDREKSVPAFLQSKINIPIINAGVSGDTTAQGLERVASDVLPYNPRIVIIELGANDLFKNVPYAATQENLQKIIDMVNDNKRKIFLVKFYTEPIAREMLSFFNIVNYDDQTSVINQYENLFNTLASSNKVELINDIWSGVWGIHMSDHIHPNENGYKIMADNYFNAIQPYLKRNRLLVK
ncbi:MAG: GDSL-type esterase/lipase family protein [Treponema sp.]|nr:GDSL-type esterase/lipase family protein [Treponema sp.]MCL2252132.1 GDSL-type esterase/lipase family protein [Treponema sp.]